MKSWRRIPWILMAAVALLVLRGGSCAKNVRSYATPTPTEVVNHVIARGLRVQSLRGQTRMSHQSNQGKIKGTVRFMAQRGGKLRFDVRSPLDTPLATLVSDGKEFTLVDAAKNRHFHGPATPCNISRLLRIVMRADDVLTALGGSTPIIGFKDLSLAWDEQAGAEVLTLKAPDGTTQVIHLDGHDKRWDLLSSEVRDPSGKVILRITPKDYRKIKGLRLPRQIHVTQPGNKAELWVHYKKLEVNIDLPAGAFDPPGANGLPSQRVDCSSVVNPGPQTSSQPTKK